jgi:hypothetical protein
VAFKARAGPKVQTVTVPRHAGGMERGDRRRAALAGANPPPKAAE